MNIRQLIVLVVGVAVTLAGARLRWQARSLAWPHGYLYNGPREDTVWWFHEQAYQHFGLLAMIFGLALIAGILLQWSRPRG